MIQSVITELLHKTVLVTGILKLLFADYIQENKITIANVIGLDLRNFKYMSVL